MVFYYKLRQILLQNAIALLLKNYLLNIITKCNSSFIKKRDKKFISKCVRFIITKCDSVITNCVVYYEMRRYSLQDVFTLNRLIFMFDYIKGCIPDKTKRLFTFNYVIHSLCYNSFL